MTPAESRILSRIERLLGNGSLAAMEKAAALILKHSDLMTLDRPFQISLMRRMGQWRDQYQAIQADIERMDDGASGMLYRMTEVPDYQMWMGPIKSSPERPREPIKPSRRAGTPDNNISNDEVNRFFDLVENEGLERIFADGACLLNGRLVMRPIITLGECIVEYEPIAKAYRERRIKRPWDPSKRKPDIAMGIDFGLLAAMAASKWTYRVWDDAVGRLPPDHRFFPRDGKRPGWKTTTRTLEMRGLLEKQRSQTWALSEQGQQVASTKLVPAWHGLCSKNNDKP